MVTRTPQQNILELKQKLKHIQYPQYTIHEFPRFSLFLIPQKFHIPEFERVKIERHIERIKTSIINNQFFDVVIRVVPHKDGAWHVIDGQHRLAALYTLHTQWGLEEYPLIVIEYAESCARNVYRRVNVGKQLAIAAHLKAIDDKRHKFFNELRDLICHDESSKILSFAEILNCLHVAKTGSRFLGIDQLDKAVSEVKDFDIEFSKGFVRAMEDSNPTKQKGIQFKPLFLRACFKICYLKKLNRVEIGNVISSGITNKEILDRIDTFNKANMEELEKLFWSIAGEART